jgi:probable rRNA maturation factor
MLPVADRRTRLYMPPLRIDVSVRAGVSRVVPLALLGRGIRAAALASGAPTPASVGLLLTDDPELAGLNREHMGRRGATDVLSFPFLPPDAFARGGQGGRHDSPPRDRRQSMTSVTLNGSRTTEAFTLPPGVRTPLGDIAVSVERAVAQAHEGRGGQDTQTTWDARDELLLLVIHGALHLCGWDHAEPGEDRAMRAFERRLLTRL